MDGVRKKLSNSRGRKEQLCWQIRAIVRKDMCSALLDEGDASNAATPSEVVNSLLRDMVVLKQVTGSETFGEATKKIVYILSGENYKDAKAAS